MRWKRGGRMEEVEEVKVKDVVVDEEVDWK